MTGRPKAWTVPMSEEPNVAALNAQIRSWQDVLSLQDWEIRWAALDPENPNDMAKAQPRSYVASGPGVRNGSSSGWPASSPTRPSSTGMTTSRGRPRSRCRHEHPLHGVLVLRVRVSGRVVVPPYWVAGMRIVFCRASTASGRPCQRPAGGPNGSDILCGLHELARRRAYSGRRPAVPWRGYRA